MTNLKYTFDNAKEFIIFDNNLINVLFYHKEN